MISRDELTAQVLALGVDPGGVLLVHTSFSTVAPVADGPRGLIDALEAAVGPEGTLVMPSMSDNDDHPFDRERTPCAAMGIVAEYLLAAVARDPKRQSACVRGERPAGGSHHRGASDRRASRHR